MERTKIDNVEIEKSWMGWRVTAYVNGEQVGAASIHMSELQAMMFIEQNYELPDDGQKG